MAEIKCPSCGSPNIEQIEADKYQCPYCGTSFSYRDAVAFQQTQQTPPLLRTDQKPDNYLVWCILSTLLCCMPLGAYAIICSSHVESYYNQGQYDKAKEESEKAKKWAIISAVCGVVGGFMYCMIMLLAEM